jgi:hypothetical protein
VHVRRHVARFDRARRAIVAEHVAVQRAEGHRRRWHRERLAEATRRDEEARREARRRRLDVALDAGDLAGEVSWGRALRRSASSSSAGESRYVLRWIWPKRRNSALAEARDHAKHALLVAPLHARLEADQVVRRSVEVLGAQLHHRVGPAVRCVGRRGRRASCSRSAACRAALGHDLDGQAALEVRASSNSWGVTFSAASTAARNASYSARSRGQFT